MKISHGKPVVFYYKDLKIYKYSILGSSNDRAWELATKGEDKFVVWALYQKKGRGKEDKIWISPPNKNLLFSIGLKTSERDLKKLNNLSLLVAKSVAQLLENYSLCPIIKYPNDIMIKNKKICGILIENRCLKRDARFLIIGIGINVNMKKEEFPILEHNLYSPTSMYEETGQYYNLQDILEKFLDIFTENYFAFNRE